MEVHARLKPSVMLKAGHSAYARGATQEKSTSARRERSSSWWQREPRLLQVLVCCRQVVVEEGASRVAAKAYVAALTLPMGDKPHEPMFMEPYGKAGALAWVSLGCTAPCAGTEHEGRSKPRRCCMLLASLVLLESVEKLVD